MKEASSNFLVKKGGAFIFPLNPFHSILIKNKEMNIVEKSTFSNNFHESTAVNKIIFMARDTDVFNQSQI